MDIIEKKLRIFFKATNVAKHSIYDLNKGMILDEIIMFNFKQFFHKCMI